MQVEMDLCTICYVEGKNCEADAPDGTLRIGGIWSAELIEWHLNNQIFFIVFRFFLVTP